VTQRIWRPRKAVRELCARDTRLARLVEAAGWPAIPQQPSTLETIAQAIAFQQLAGPAANAIWSRVVALFGNGGLEPRAVLRKRDATYRKAGLSAPKTRSIKDLARHIVDGRLLPEALHTMDDEAVMAALLAEAPRCLARTRSRRAQGLGHLHGVQGRAHRPRARAAGRALPPLPLDPRLVHVAHPRRRGVGVAKALRRPPEYWGPRGAGVEVATPAGS
jgi:hypothetical protein